MWRFRAALIGSSAQLVLLLLLVATHRVSVSAVLAANLLLAVATWYLTNRVRVGSNRPSWDPVLLRESLRHGFLLNLGMAFLFLHLRVDMFMVKAFLGVAQLGIYSLAVVLAETVLLITDSMAIALVPRQVRREPAEAAAFALEGARASMVLGLFLLGGGLLVGRPAIRFFFGQDFEPAFLPFACLLPGVVFLGMQRFTGAPLLMAGKTGLLTWVYAVSLALNVGLNFVLIPRWGGTGAAVASSLSYTAGAMLFLGWTSRLAGVSMFRGLIPSKDDVVRLRAALARESHRLRARFKPDR
jgi:O-antigen/teichoic acid export membrane protein